MLLRNPDRKLIAAMHAWQHYRDRAGALARLGRSWSKLRHLFWTVITGSDIHRDATIHATVRFPHLTGIVIHPGAVVEEGCLIMQQVTLGQVTGPGAPHLQKGVYVGAGARILGGVRIGVAASIGANAVVLDNIPAWATAVGVPATVKKIRTPD